MFRVKEFLTLIPTIILLSNPLCAENWSGFYEAEDDEKKVLYRLALKDNGIFYFYYSFPSMDYETTIPGVWIEREGERYYYIKEEHVSEFGQLKGELTEEGLKLEMHSDLFMVWPTPLPRVEPYEISWNPSEEEREALLQRLKEVLFPDELPETGVAEIASEEELKEQFEGAIRAKDLTMLMNMTYLHDFRYDRAAQRWYQEYAAVTDFADEINLETPPSQEKALEGLAGLMESGYSFPESSEVRGVIHVLSQRGGGSGLHYGTVDGNWFILGHPMKSSESVEEDDELASE